MIRFRAPATAAQRAGSGAIATALAIVALLSTAPSAMAQEVARTITVTGSATVSRVPDLAVLRVGVEAQAPDSDRAIRAMTERAAAVMGQLAGAGIPESAIRTDVMRLAPLRPDDGRAEGTPRPVRATTVLAVEVADLDSLGPLLDSLVRAGANRVEGVRFTLADPAAARAEAQRQAVADARASAEAYAGAAGVSLGPVLAITDAAGGGLRPLSMQAAIADGGPPVAPGEVSLTASVTVVFGLGG